MNTGLGHGRAQGAHWGNLQPNTHTCLTHARTTLLLLVVVVVGTNEAADAVALSSTGTQHKTWMYIPRKQCRGCLLQGSKLSVFIGDPIAPSKAAQRCCIYIETSTSSGSLQKFEGAVVEFKGALGFWNPQFRALN